MRRARTLVLAILGAIVVATASALPANAQPTAGAQAERNPILFVHGWAEADWVWNTMIDRFRQDGWSDDELHNWKYNTGQSNKKTAREVRQKVNEILSQTGAEQVDLITHSMGGLNTRWYIKFLGGEPQVDDWVSLGGPNHGTEIAGLCGFLQSCVEMRVGSDFLAQLNAGDETSGQVNYGTFWSTTDAITNPNKSVLLDGAANHNVGDVGHIALTQDETVYPGVRDFVR